MPVNRTLAEIPNTAGTSLFAEAQQMVGTPSNDPTTWNQNLFDYNEWQWVPPSEFTRLGTPRYTVSCATGNYVNQCRRPVPRHNGGLNVTYVDGHAKWMPITKFLGPLPEG